MTLLFSITFFCIIIVIIDQYHKENVKANRLFYYVTHALPLFLVPKIFYTTIFKINKEKLTKQLKNSGDLEHVNYRVNYYNKISTPHTLQVLPKISKVKKDPYINLLLSEYFSIYKHKTRSYYLDLNKGIRYFKNKKRVSIQFGDVRIIHKQPTLVKSRLICKDNGNNVLLKLDKVRHFLFVKDKKKFNEKKGKLVWRGAAHTPLRRTLLKKFHKQAHHLINTPFILDKKMKETRKVNFLTIRQQLDYKYILSIEGNDVATNLKWIMSSNSIVFMTKPTCESWFMEGDLIANHHYVEIQNDWSDLVEKIEYCNNNPEFCTKILDNAQKYVSHFKNQKSEKLITMMVLEKYFNIQK